MTSRVPLSILDLVPVSEGMTNAQAMQASTDLAQAADRLGYHRLWMAEHHGSPVFLSSATSVLLAHMASRTEHIRLGSGGVMLPNHAPLMVAEQYGTLATLYGDRIDLGLGRAPGTDPMTAAALRRDPSGGASLDSFAQDVLDLTSWLAPHGQGLSGSRLRAIPGEGTQVPIWMLGSSTGGAQVAAALGLPFSFASHFAPQQLVQALAVYRAGFRADAPTAQVERPTVMAGVNVVVAPTRAEAERLATSGTLLAAGIRTGRPAPLQPPVDDITTVLPRPVAEQIGAGAGVRVVGTPDEVVARLEAFVAEHQLDELITTTYVHDPALRVRSAELLAAAWGLQPRD